MLTITWRLFVLLTLLTGGVYPLLTMGMSQVCFPWQANGSLLKMDDQLIGSQLIGQNFTKDAYFWGRPPVTIADAYNGLASGGSNLGPTNPQLLTSIQGRISERRLLSIPIPIDLVTASASGLDPEISPAAAYYQTERIAIVRNMSIEQVQSLVQTHIQTRTFHLLGEPRVNVLALNLALDMRDSHVTRAH